MSILFQILFHYSYYKVLNLVPCAVSESALLTVLGDAGVAYLGPCCENRHAGRAPPPSLWQLCTGWYFPGKCQSLTVLSIQYQR